MSDYYHIFIIPKAGVNREKVEEQMNHALDWFRYHNACYVVKTTSDENKWQERLQPLVNPSGHLFICKFDPRHFHGWMTQEFWDWIEPEFNPPPQIR